MMSDTKNVWKSLAVGITSFIVVLGVTLLIMSPVKSNVPLDTCSSYTYLSIFPFVCFAVGLVVGFIAGISLYIAFKQKKEVDTK